MSDLPQDCGYNTPGARYTLVNVYIDLVVLTCFAGTS